MMDFQGSLQSRVDEILAHPASPPDATAPTEEEAVLNGRLQVDLERATAQLIASGMLEDAFGVQPIHAPDWWLAFTRAVFTQPKVAPLHPPKPWWKVW